MSSVFVIGAGPGIGTAVARRFARERLDVGLLARSPDTLARAASAVGSGVAVRTAVADVTDEAALQAALAHLVEALGVPDVLVYNAAVVRADAIGDLDAAGHRDAWAVNVGGAISAAAFLLPRMVAAGGGSYLLTGGMPDPLPQLTSLSLGKAGLRALVALLDRQFAPDLHVATVTVCGPVAPGTAYDPDDIAEHYARLHAQPPGARDTEVRHGDPADAAG